MNKDRDNHAPPKAPRCQKQQNAQQQQQHQNFQNKNHNLYTKDAPGGSKNKPSGATGILAPRRISAKEKKTEKYNRLGKAELGTTECQKNQSAQRKLSDASNASEDLSKDSGCLSGKVSSSDSSSEMSDCQSEDNKLALDTQSRETDLSGSGTALDSSSGDRPTFTHVTDTRSGDNPSASTWQDNAIYVEGDGYNSPGTCGDPIASFPSIDVSVAYSGLTGELLSETTDDLVREVDDLRSENEYLKDEMEELRCEMLEMRDMFLEEEVYQLQELRVQLDQANKLCRILQYRLRKAERRSIRVAQTGQVDGELVRTLEHDIKVAKSVSVRLHSELESVQQKKSQLEWENEALRERLQDLEVAKQVLQAEMEKARESSLKRRSVRLPIGKPEKKLSPQDDSADLICQLHFAREESALMCKKLTKLALDSDHMREELARYRSVYGDIDASCSSEGTSNSPYARESEVKVHLRLVEEEATLLSRRIVELELENHGLRAEMSDLRERGGGGAEEEGEPQDGGGEHLASPAEVRDSKEGEQGLRRGYTQLEDGEMTEEKEGVQHREFQHRDNDQSPAEGLFPQSQIARVGPIGGEQEPLDSHKSDSTEKSGGAIHGLSLESHEVLLALRNHACLVGSAIQILTTPVQNGHCSSPSSPYAPWSERDPQGQVHPKGLDPPLHGYLYGALELLQTMLLTFVSRMERLMTPEGEPTSEGVKGGWRTDNIISQSEACDVNDADVQDILESPGKQETVEDLSETEVAEHVKQATQESEPSSQWNHFHGCGDPITRLTLQILWVLHQRCVRGQFGVFKGKEVRETSMHVLQDLLLELGSEVQEMGLTDRGTEGTQTDKAESPVNTIVGGERSLECKRTSPKETKHRKFKRGSHQKNRCYLSREAVQLDQIHPFKTWDHPIMPFSFPGLDLDQMTLERSHTAPEKTALCIYYSPPSARRVQLAHLKQSPSIVRNSPAAISPCLVSSSSVSSFCLRLSANLSDDMKEMTASIQQAVHHPSSLERRRNGSVGQRWVVDVASSGTQTQMQQQPKMVDVGLQTDRLHTVNAVRAGSPRVPSSSLPGRTRHISSLERMPGRTDRPKSGSSSPKLYRRPSASTTSSLSTFTSSTTSANSYSFSSSPAPTERSLMNISQSSPARLTCVRPTNTRTGPVTVLKHSALSGDVDNIKPPSKPVAANRYGLVTEFLRRVSGRVDKPTAPGVGQKGKSVLKNLERPPSTRPPAASLHRNDSITRIVNQRFMKQREEAGRVQKEEKGQSLSQVVKVPVSRDQSLSTITSEGGNYECSSKTLTFCFAQSSRSTQHHASGQAKLRRQGYPAAMGGTGDANCE